MILRNSDIDEYVYAEFQHFNRFPEEYKRLRIHNSLLNKLRKNYYCDELVEHFYDWEEHDDGTPMTNQERMSFCNWNEPYFKGNWGMSQEFVDKWALNQLKACRKWNVDKSHRFFIKEENNIIEIFAFGRDKYYSDYWWVYKKKGEKPNKGLPVRL